MSVWHEFTEDEYTAVWGRFYTGFNFKPDYHERLKPAISEPKPSVTFNLAEQLDDAVLAEIGNLLLESFRSITPTGEQMYFLDWHHTCYRFAPHNNEGFGPANWYPDGDYHIFLSRDLSFGTFGHPWQQSLCMFGSSLLGVAEQAFRGKLEVLRESTP